MFIFSIFYIFKSVVTFDFIISYLEGLQGGYLQKAMANLLFLEKQR